MSRFETRVIEDTEVRIKAGERQHCLVMLHGIGSNAHSFDRLTTHLPDHWMMVAWNAPGYGKSKPVLAESPTAKDYSERLQKVTSALELQSFDLVGHSLGTIIAADFACRAPAVVRNLVLMACAQGYGMGSDDPLPQKAVNRLQDLDRLGPHTFAQERAPRLLSNPDLHPTIRDEAIEAMAAIHPGGYTQAVHLLAGGNLKQTTKGVQCPSVVIVGTDDRITPPEQSETVSESLTELGLPSEYHVIENAGHLVHQEQADKVAQIIMSFAKRREPEGTYQ